MVQYGFNAQRRVQMAKKIMSPDSSRSAKSDKLLKIEITKPKEEPYSDAKPKRATRHVEVDSSGDESSMTIPKPEDESEETRGY